MFRLLSCLALLAGILSTALTLAILSTTMAVAAGDPTEILNQETQDGFVPLFNGKNLDGWIGEYQGVKAKDGMIVIEQGCRGAMLTEKEYGDFVLRFDFCLHPGSNNGLTFRTPKDKIFPEDGMELQILDNSAEKYATLEPYQYHGSLYYVAPAKQGFLKPVGEWNSQEISCIGSKLKVTLNGEVILDVDMNDFDPNNTLGKHPVPALRYTKGHLGFLSHDDPIEVRNIRIKEIKPEAPAKEEAAK